MGKRFKVDKDKSDEVEKVVKLISITPDAENLIAYCARVSSKTKLYMTGNVRSWIHYLDQRCKWDTQQEHRELALEMRKIIKEQLPTIAKAVAWK